MNIVVCVKRVPLTQEVEEYLRMHPETEEDQSLSD